MFAKHLEIIPQTTVSFPPIPKGTNLMSTLRNPQFHLFDGTAHPTATLRPTPSKAVLGLRTDTLSVGRSRQRSTSAYQNGFVSAV
jgi:hypothetical protein